MISTLAEALPAAEFVEHHSRVIDASPEHVWSALSATKWSDLRWTRGLIALRGLGSSSASERSILERGPVVVVQRDEPGYVAGVRIARPWKAVPDIGPTVASLGELAQYRAPGWIKFGMDFTLQPLPGGRTRLSTSTLCEPTDEHARRRFARYWRVIAPFSGLIRRDLLCAVERRAYARAPITSGT